MTDIKKGLLMPLVVIDAFLTTWIIVTTQNAGTLAGWIVLHIVVIIAIFIIQNAIAKRRNPFRPSVQYRKDTGPARNEHRGYGVPSMTINNEQVRSKGEKIIADYLLRKGIIYSYENPVYAKDGQYIGKPDFYLPTYDAYVEYWGLLEVRNPRKQAEYVEQMNWKLEKYARNGVKLISLYPEDLDDLDRTLYNRLTVYTSK